MKTTPLLPLPDYQAIAFWSLTLSVCLLPIGLGGDRPIPVGLFQFGLALCACCLALSPQTEERLAFFAPLRAATTLITIALFWGVIQILPIVPASWTHPMWQEAGQALHRHLPASISITPVESLQGVMRMATIILTGLLSYIVMQKPERAIEFVRTFWRSGLVICAYGTAVHVLGLHKILWFDKWTFQSDLTATFVNHNDFALYADLVIMAGLALLLRSWRRNFRDVKPHRKMEAVQSWMAKRGIPYGMGIALIFGCVAASHSRAGLVLAFVGMGLYLFLYAIYRKEAGHAAAVATVGGVGLAAGLFFVMQSSQHFAVLFQDYSSRDRWTVYQLTLQAIMENPWLGYGLHGFQAVFRTHQQFMIMDFDRAHNDILEIILDLGIPAALCLITGVGLLLLRLLHGLLTRRRNGLFPVLALSSSLVILSHACVNFSLQIPGISMLWAGLLGCGLAQSWSEHQKDRG
ncbi:MAG: O-antigen ligase family protein [Alphaproteobacteria bacterium]|nr:O-antigen ligase family protein [Alphaproteobacteria bacterium]